MAISVVGACDFETRTDWTHIGVREAFHDVENT